MQTIKHATLTDIALIALTALLWASSFVAIKVAVPETGPFWLAAIRVLIGFIVLLPYAIYRGFMLPRGQTMWLLVLGMSVLNVVFPFLLISWAELTIDAGVASLLMGTGPFFALLGSHLFTTDDRLTVPKLVGVLCGFSGVLVIVGVDAIEGLGSNLAAQSACVGGALCYIAAGLLIRRIDIPPGRLACLALGISGIVLVALAAWQDGAPPLDLTPEASMSLVYLGLLPTGFAYMLRFYLIRKIGYSTFSIGLNLIPVFGVLLSLILLGEPLTLKVTVALVLVVCGLFIARMSPKTDHKAGVTP
ncbi:MAG: DMT family transporter [Alphaproteobacteria bacterium]|nr:DMT family transporter [Alphaproteobacteria bacterium]